jgi:adenosylcobyric acid synthase
MAHEIDLDAEDAVCLEDDVVGQAFSLPVAIVRLPHISNFTDFRLLQRYARWVTRPVDARFDAVILPGTKNTIGDLEWLRRNGLDEWILEQSRAGARVIGVCGGYQMMGESIADPHRVESSSGEARGLGLLPAATELRAEKTVRPIEATTPSGIRFAAYEIHMGDTPRPADVEPFAILSDGTAEGVRFGRHAGTYLHGALECAQVVSELLGWTVPAAAPREHTYAQLSEWFDRYQRGFEEMYL